MLTTIHHNMDTFQTKAFMSLFISNPKPSTAAVGKVQARQDYSINRRYPGHRGPDPIPLRMAVSKVGFINGYPCNTTPATTQLFKAYNY